tara:strand:+ start:145 stop:480 length:336 start_codon:yes stop_codon:yes gene_type:complete
VKHTKTKQNNESKTYLLFLSYSFTVTLFLFFFFFFFLGATRAAPRKLHQRRLSAVLAEQQHSVLQTLRRESTFEELGDEIKELHSYNYNHNNQGELFLNIFLTEFFTLNVI